MLSEINRMINRQQEISTHDPCLKEGRYRTFQTTNNDSGQFDHIANFE